MTSARRVRRVFIGFTEISGFYSALAEGFARIGVETTFVDTSPNVFEYRRGEAPRVARAYMRFKAKRTGSARPVAIALLPVDAGLRLALFAWAVVRHDAFLFGFGTSFFRQYDLRLLRLLGKRVVCQFHGSDSRPPYIDRAVTRGVDPAAVDACIRATRERRRIVARASRWSDAVIDNPTSGHFHVRSLVMWLKLGIPRLPYEGEHEAGPADRPVRILHAPSDSRAKGTGLIRRAVERLESRGVPVEYVELQGVPHRRVEEELERCDLVVDQVYSDYAMPGFAAEAAWRAKPVVIAGYPVDLWQELLGPDERPPTRFVEPDGLEAAIEALAASPEARRELGLRARDFVADRWRPDAVAERYRAVLEGRVPDDWLFDPAATTYVEGCGLARDEAREIVRAVVGAGGAGALQLRDKPDVERRLLEFARIEPPTLGPRDGPA